MSKITKYPIKVDKSTIHYENLERASRNINLCNNFFKKPKVFLNSADKENVSNRDKGYVGGISIRFK